MEAKKLLVVDDQYGIRLLLHELFTKEGYVTFQAANGQEALEIIGKRQPHIVLLDMKIPGMDGLEILKHIQSLHEQAKVIVMTAYGELNIINEAMKLGAIAFFAKPFDIDEIKTFVKNAV